MNMLEKWKKEDRKKIVETLQEQLEIEGRLVVLYEEYERRTNS